jgi:hypothetical protein
LNFFCGNPSRGRRAVEQRRLAEVDARRVVITAAFGAAFMGPVGHFWYHQLDVVCGRLLATGTPGFLAAKLIADTLIMGPLYVVAFYAWGCALIDGSGLEGFKKKITQVRRWVDVARGSSRERGHCPHPNSGFTGLSAM